MDRFGAIEGNRVGVTDIELWVGELGMLRQVVSEPLCVVTHNLMAVGEQMRHQHRAFAAAVSCNKDSYALW